MEDSAIVQLYWTRNETAIFHTERKYGSYLMKIAYNILADREDSQESVNDTYLAAWDAIPPHRPQNLCAFLSKITRRIAIDLLRRQQSRKRGSGNYDVALSELDQCLSGGNTTEEIADGNALAQAIGVFLKTRTPAARTAFVCRYFYMDSLKETARACGLTESNTKVILHRTRQALREYLEKEGYL
jgi:RNA polymerase sigma-70 factor (ECF subfamily)